MSFVEVKESIILCSVLAGLGGVLEVFGTAVLAYPAAKAAQEGVKWSDCSLRIALALNLLFQFLASMAGNLTSTWFGPISVAGPVFFAAQLVANLVVFWIVLGIEMFTKQMQIGTYVIVVAVALLLRVGPGTQEDQNFEDLIMKPYALGWFIICVIAMLAGSLFLIPGCDLKNKLSQRWMIYAVLLIVRGTAFAINLTTGRAIILKASTTWQVISFAIKIISGAIYAGAIVVQSTVVEQSTFVPINACITLLINAISGVLIWEDYKVIGDWTGYVCVFILFALGSLLLLGDFQPLSETNPQAFRPRYDLLRQKGRRELFDNIRRYADDESMMVMDEPSARHEMALAGSIHNTPSHRQSLKSTGSGRAVSRRESWAALYGVQKTKRFHRASMIRQYGRGSAPVLGMHQSDMDDLIAADLEMDDRDGQLRSNSHKGVDDGDASPQQKLGHQQEQHMFSAGSLASSGRFRKAEMRISDIEEGSEGDDTSQSQGTTPSSQNMQVDGDGNGATVADDSAQPDSTLPHTQSSTLTPSQHGSSLDPVVEDERTNCPRSVNALGTVVRRNTSQTSTASMPDMDSTNESGQE